MKTAMFSLMLGMLAIGGLIAGGALMAGQAYAQTAILSQTNVANDNDVQEDLALACQISGELAATGLCGNSGEANEI
jgi:hypothetical protein